MSEELIQAHPATYWIRDRRKPQESWQEDNGQNWCAIELESVEFVTE